MGFYEKLLREACNVFRFFVSSNCYIREEVVAAASQQFIDLLNKNVKIDIQENLKKNKNRLKSW
jgi:hypothetical protein